MTVNTAPLPYVWTFRRVVWATLILAFVIFCFWLIFRFYEVFFMMFIAIVIGTVIRPAANWLHQRGLPRVAGVLAIYLLMLLLIGAFLWLLFPLVFEQAATLISDVPTYYHNLRLSMINSPNPLFARLGIILPAVLPGGQNQAPPTGQSAVASAGQVVQYLLVAAQVIFIVVVILILTLYWTLDGPRLIKSLLLLIPQDQRESINELIAIMESKVGFYIVGQGILCLVIGVMALIAYLLIGLPNALALAIAAGIMEAVPMIGPVLGAIPAGVVALSISVDRLIWVIVATVVIQQLENSLLVPRIMRSTVGVNPFVTLLAIFAFGSLFGIVGVLMAIPIAAVIQVLLNHYVFQTATVEMEITKGRDLSSRLRYEAQDLVNDLRKQARHEQEGSDETVMEIEHAMDEIESLTSDLDALLARLSNSEPE